MNLDWIIIILVQQNINTDGWIGGGHLRELRQII